MIRTLLFFSLILCLGGFQAQAQAVADFSATPRTLCIQPYEVSFFNLSQGDTALLWDFGDGNTSSFSQPNHVYQNPGTYTVTLIAYGPGGNDTLVQPGFVVINASPADPVVSPAADTVACGSSARFVASGQPDLLWTDSNGTLVARGDTLDIPLASQSRTFFVRSEQEGAPTRVGPVDPDSVGGGGFFNGDQGLVFDVFSDLRIKSALVNAGAAGVRTFTLTDTFGIVLETLDVFIPAGRSRVPLDLELIPGSYVIRGNGVNLFRNNAGNPAYPFEAPGLISIRTSTVGNDFYYFFYDWEVVTFCRSNEVQVDLTVDPLSGPSLASDTVTADCGNSAELIASAANEVAWYDLADNFLAQGDTFRLPFAGGNSLFFVRNTSNSNSLSVGAADPDSLGSAGGYQQGGPAIWLNFEVFSDMTLQSVWVDADSAGDRNIQVRDGAGGLVALQVVSLPAGRSRVNLDLDLTPGEYLIGGANLGLFRNDSTNVAYPYSLPGIVSITGSSTGEQTYNFFYDWEVGVTCLSDRDSMVLQVNPPLAPSVSPDSVTVTCSGSAQFVASGLNQIVWTDNTDAILQRGDTLNLQGITSSGTFFAQDVAESNPEFVGPLNGDTTGTGGYYNFNFFAYQEFEVYADIRIESAWVDANTPGQRTVEIRDLGNNLLQSVSVNIPAGQGRVNLGIELTPGTYRIGGLNMDLFRNTNGPDYPYVLPGALAITGSSAQASQNFYYFFYDWEVVRLCKSPKVPVEVILTPPPAPVISPASVSADCGDNVQLVATAINDVSWYDQNNLLLQQGDTLNLTGVTGTASYFARSVAEGTPAQVGPVDGTSVGGGGYHNFNIFSYLEFEVYSSLRLQSVWVDANTGGNRTIELRDGLGNPLQSIQVNIPAGQSRVTLNLELEPGSYQIGGFNMDLFRNNAGNPAYPYEQPGLISIMGSSAGPGFYYYLYDWEVVPLCQGPLAQVDVTVGALAAPVLDSSQVTVPCNGSTTVIASGNGVTKWYDANGLLIASGDTLQTPPVINNTTLFAQQESPSTSVFGQPQDNAIGGGGFFASDARWLIFDVNQPGLLRSVKVYAENPGNRTIEYRDATGNVLESTTVFIPTGESRVALNFELVPGSDQQLAINGTVDLFRNNTGINYPYTVGPYVTIVSSNVPNNPTGFYYFFYNWEVSELVCQSPSVPLDINVSPLPSPSVTASDSACYGERASFSASTATSSWFDPNGNFLGVGQNFTTPPLTTSGTYTARAESQELRFRFGPFDAASVGPGGYLNSNLPARMEFDVLNPVRLNSVWVDANSEGNRTIVLEDDQGTLIQSFNVFIPKGQSRVGLGIELQPGSYAIGGQLLDLFRNTTGAVFPYTTPGKVSITGSSEGGGFYFFFYDWEVQDIPCQSNDEPFQVGVRPDMQAGFSFNQSGNDVTFQGSAARGNTYRWDFGDGSTSNLQNPTHTFQNAGTYVVTLTVSDGICEDSFEESIRIENGLSLTDLVAGSFRLYPNPGNGIFRLEAHTHTPSDLQVVVFDLQGRQLMASPVVRSNHIQQSIDLSERPAGSYLLQLRVGGASVVKKYVLIK